MNSQSLIPYVNTPKSAVFTGIDSGYNAYGATRIPDTGYRWYNSANLGPDWLDGTSKASAGPRAKLKNWFSQTKNKASGAVNKVANPANYGWSKTGGLKAFGKNIGKGANIAGGVIQGIDALSGIDNYADTIDSNEDLLSKIRVSAMGNPLLSSYLTSDQLNLLGNIQNDAYGTGATPEDFFKGTLSGLGSAVPAALLGLALGGIPGAVIGGGGTLINSGIDNLSSAAGENTAELQALYQALQDAEMQYKSMKRPNFTGLGIQQQYQNMYA